MTLFAGSARIKWGPRASYAWLAALALAAGLGMAAPASADDPPEWSTPVKPFNIAGDVYYVGTKGLAAYLIVSNQGAILLDGLLPRTPR
jgi:metallo-beta-lactamase class B